MDGCTCIQCQKTGFYGRLHAVKCREGGRREGSIWEGRTAGMGVTGGVAGLVYCIRWSGPEGGGGRYLVCRLLDISGWVGLERAFSWIWSAYLLSVESQGWGNWNSYVHSAETKSTGAYVCAQICSNGHPPAADTADLRIWVGNRPNGSHLGEIWISLLGN
jgi:hypothetical protein